jgi:hypothetical protein
MEIDLTDIERDLPRAIAAAAAIKEMAAWFSANYLPHEEGYSAEEVLREKYEERLGAEFGDDDEEILEAALAEIEENEEDGVEGWISIKEQAEIEAAYAADRAADDGIELSGLLPLLRAADHHWGKGHVHLIVEDSDPRRTLCGQTPARCPGESFWGMRDEITCKACMRMSRVSAGCNAELGRVK